MVYWRFGRQDLTVCDNDRGKSSGGLDCWTASYRGLGLYRGLHCYRVPGGWLCKRFMIWSQEQKAPVLWITQNYTRPATNTSVWKHLVEIGASKHFIISGRHWEGPAEATPYTSFDKHWAFNGALKTSWAVAGFSVFQLVSLQQYKLAAWQARRLKFNAWIESSWDSNVTDTGVWLLH